MQINSTSKHWAILSYFSFLVFIPLNYLQHDDFVMKHARQGLMLFFLEICAIFWTLLPVIGKLTAWVGWIFILLMFCIGVAQAFQGKEFVMTIFGENAKKWKFHGKILP